LLGKLLFFQTTSSKDVFILTAVKLAKGYTTVHLAEHFGFSSSAFGFNQLLAKVNIVFRSSGAFILLICRPFRNYTLNLVLRALIHLPVRRSTDYYYKSSSLYKSEKGSCTP